MQCNCTVADLWALPHSGCNALSPTKLSRNHLYVQNSNAAAKFAGASFAHEHNVGASLAFLNFDVPHMGSGK